MAVPTRDAFTALQRFGLGARAPGDLADIASDPRGAVLAEIESGVALLAEDGLPATAAALQEVSDFRADRRKAEEMASAPAAPMRNAAGDTYRAEAEARFRAATAAPVGFAERLVWFWSNHFCIAAGRSTANRITAGAFEREAIRPHVFGRFADMLLAVEQHPAMLIYLDNRTSVGPNSRAGERRNRGLNENLAREILELHTLGPDSGYTQADVTALAHALTGWTVIGRTDEDHELGHFYFNPNRHEPGPQTILGTTYPEPDIRQGEHALLDIARHPAAARMVATKLVRHFVADDPPEGLVLRLARAFTDSDGDLREVARTLVTADEAWSAGPTKIRTPQEYAAAVLRATGQPARGPLILAVLNSLGQPLWNPPGPNGFPDTCAHWISAEGMRTRLDVAVRLTKAARPDADPGAILETVIGPVASPETREAVARAESRPQALALLLMSPEFQRR